ncbi:methanol dehydrogenase [Methylobacterium tarhaniae]|uniref:Methanol dehydrogenase n=1 Tax=Methylobacterium tarhaniae TaxID=1187852 RepID=A0A0J6TEZ6_9HYPH|nr:methanol/ethanol family PQQ-dependent dehydrogenase [Methylobacterium tarhaniae]KMO44253.1 methanol dehydrogenase [Methylobacterium tarhaniae]
MSSACAQELSPPAHPVPPAAASPIEDGQWTMPAKNFASTRYSELSEITPETAKDLRVSFTFSVGVNRGQESSPLVVDGTMYVLSPYPNILYALDLTKPGAALKWQYNPKPEAAAQGVACCDVVNRGPAYADGHLFFNTLDGNVVSVEAATGREAWKTKIGNINIGETMTMAPLVARGKVFVGNAGGEFGVRGWIQALDQQTGKVAWKAFNTGPDADVLIGPGFRPFYDSDKGPDLGTKTWPPGAWEQGGGTVWGWLSFDPELNLLYHGTGNPGPWNADQRPGDNKWTSGLFARDPDTGAARWFYQWSPHDLYDWDGINEQILLDMTWNGAPRKVLVRPERNGHVYILDRTTGEVLAAKPFHPITTTTGVDLKTGRLQYIPEKKPEMGKVMRDICPNASGAKDWSPSAYSPRTGLLYLPHANLCMDEEHLQANYIAGTPYLGSETRMKAGPGGHRGVYTAWDVAGERAAWSIKEEFPVWSGTLVTAGDVAFYGTMDGWFKAVNARTGAVVWQFKTGSGIIGQPTTYRAPDGRQHVAILSGVGGWPGVIVSADLDPRDGTGALGFLNAMRDLKEVTTKGGMLYDFALP